MAPQGKKPRHWFMTILILIVLAGIGYAAYKKFSPQHHNKIQTDNIAEVTTGNIESVVTAQGKLEPKDYVDVGAQVSGQITKLHADIGDTVKTGTLIAEIDPQVYRSKVEGDEARLKTLQAEKAEQVATLKQARQKNDRNKTLIKQKAISKEALEDTQAAFDIAQSQLASLEAQIEEAQSTLDGDRANLNYTKIYAPMDGTVVSQSTKEGQTINASQTAPVIVQIANLDVMTVRAQVAEADVGKLSNAMPVYFTTMGSQGRRWEGRVRQILPSPETVNDVVLYDVLVDVDNKDHSLMTGMTTQMFFLLGQADNIAVIPATALVKRANDQDTEKAQAYTVTVLENHKPIEKTVLVGLSDRTKAQVISGLNVGDKILLPSSASKETSGAPTAQAPRGGMRGMAHL